jgi:DNA-binding MarR family transcriptional regulator
MATATQLDFADRAGRFYARQYGFPPVTGRLLGYLAVCDPPAQTIADLAEALRASRSAITGSVKQLESFRAVQRTRAAGDRVDRVSIDPAGLEPKGFDPAEYQQQAALAREALSLLPGAPAERRAVLAEAAALNEFLAQRLPELLQEWRAKRADG